MQRFILLVLCVGIFFGCRSTRKPEAVTPGLGFSLLTYNVNWGGVGAREVAAILQNSDADILCLQETTPAWEKYLRQQLGSQFSYAAFRETAGRMGGGLAFFSKVPAREVAYVRSETGWFDGWVVEFETAIGPPGPAPRTGTCSSSNGSGEGG